MSSDRRDKAQASDGETAHERRPSGGSTATDADAKASHPRDAAPDDPGSGTRPALRIDRGGPLLDPASAYLAQLGPGSRRTMREALDKLARLASDGRCDLHDLPWHLLQLDHTAALRTRLCATLAPSTANKHMAALRGVLKQCWRQGSISAADYQRITDLPPIRGGPQRPGFALTSDDFERLTRACASDESPAGARDEALISLLRSSSLRRAEAVALDLDDYDPSDGSILVRDPNRDPSRRLDRRLPTSPRTRLAIDRWIARRGREAGPLFNPVNKGGRIERRRLSEQAIYIACQKRASEAGLPPTSPEDLRRPVSGP